MCKPLIVQRASLFFFFFWHKSPKAIATRFSLWAHFEVKSFCEQWMTEMERILFKSVSDRFPACPVSQRERESAMIDGLIPPVPSFFLRWGMCVLFDSLCSCRGDISPLLLPFLQWHYAAALRPRLWVSSLGYSYLFIFCIFSDCQARVSSCGGGVVWHSLHLEQHSALLHFFFLSDSCTKQKSSKLRTLD